MTEKANDIDVMFYQLILSIQGSVMHHLGKVVSPITGKIERDLEAARYSIDMLDMLERKTSGNLSPEEKKLFDHVLYELRMNYIDEVNKGEPAQPASKEEAGPEGGETVH